jgi:hypothetical protein
VRAPIHWSAHHPSEDQELSGSLLGGSWPVTCRDPALGTNTDCEPSSHRTVISRPSTSVTTPLRVTLPTFSDSTSTRSPTSTIVASCGVVTKPGLPKCPLRRSAPFKMSATIVLAVQSSYPAACDTTGRVAWCTCILAPGATTCRARPTDAGRRSMRYELPLAAKRRKVSTSRSSDTDCCPFAAHGRIRGADVGAGEAFALVMAHETPGDPRVRALPSPYRARALVSPGVSCRRARWHASRRGVNANGIWPVDKVGGGC